MSDYMTGAELQCLREACGLDRDQFAEMCGIGGKPPGRTIKYWETGASNHGVPADVAALVLELEDAVSRDAANEIARHAGADNVVLVRTANPVANEVASRVYLGLRRRGQAVRMVAFDYPAYCAWLTKADYKDKPAHRQEWAQQAVTLQARPHRADQPQ